MTLDTAFALWAKDGSETALNDLMRGIRQRAMCLTHDDDTAQQVCITVLERLDEFKPLDPSAFTRYVASTIKKHRLTNSRRRVYESTDDGREETAPEQEPSFDIPEMNAFQAQVATGILAGFTLKEIAGQMNLRESTLRKRLFDMR